MHKLESILTEVELSVDDLSELTGITVATINRILRRDLTHRSSDDMNTNRHTAAIIARQLYLRVEDIFSPCELSDSGRPPLTGKALAHLHASKTIDTCKCGYVYPVMRVCHNCNPDL